MDKQHVLIVEDETALQQILEDALDEAGFAVSASANGKDAIEKLEHPSAVYVALVTDINLGNFSVTGWDVARRARELDGAIAVVYSTGAEGADWPEIRRNECARIASSSPNRSRQPRSSLRLPNCSTPGGATTAEKPP